MILWQTAAKLQCIKLARFFLGHSVYPLCIFQTVIFLKLLKWNITYDTASVTPSDLVNNAAAKQHRLTLAMSMKVQRHQRINANRCIVVHYMSLHNNKSEMSMGV